MVKIALITNFELSKKFCLTIVQPSFRRNMYASSIIRVPCFYLGGKVWEIHTVQTRQVRKLSPFQPLSHLFFIPSFVGGTADFYVQFDIRCYYIKLSVLF